MRLADKLGDIVTLNAPVRRITQTGDQVTVISDAGEFTASRVIVAVPPPPAAAIDWDPLLPTSRMQLLQRMPMAALMKCDAVYPTPFWRQAGLSGMGLNAGRGTWTARSARASAPPPRCSRPRECFESGLRGGAGSGT